MTATTSSSRAPGTSKEPMSSSTSGGSGSRRHLDGDRLVESGVAVGRPDPHDGGLPRRLGQADEGAGEHGRVGSASPSSSDLDRDAGLDHGGGLRLVGDAPHGIRLLERGPRLAGEQPRGDPRGGDEQDEASARAEGAVAQEAGRRGRRVPRA